MESRLVQGGREALPVAPKYKHATTLQDIKGIILFVRLNEILMRSLGKLKEKGKRQRIDVLTSRFLVLRRWLVFLGIQSFIHFSSLAIEFSHLSLMI